VTPGKTTPVAEAMHHCVVVCALMAVERVVEVVVSWPNAANAKTASRITDFKSLFIGLVPFETGVS
jgi:hypothetical protein